MARTAIATDSNSGITQSQAKELGVFVLPMPFFMRGKIQFEDIDLTQEQFYEILAEDAAVSTSQPSPGDLMDFWNKILEEYHKHLRYGDICGKGSILYHGDQKVGKRPFRLL